MNKNAGFGMLRRHVVAINGHPPALVSPELHIAVQAINHRGKLGPKEEDVDATKPRGFVKKVCYRLLQNAFGKIGNQIAVHINSCATLKTHS